VRRKQDPASFVNDAAFIFLPVHVSLPTPKTAAQGHVPAKFESADAFKEISSNFEYRHREYANKHIPSRNSSVKKSSVLLFVAMVTILLGGCLDNGSQASPPSSITATAGDSRVIVSWTGSPGVDYWLFSATNPSLTAFNWTGLPNAHVYFRVTSPYYICGLLSDTSYYFAMNGRTGGGPGGPSSPTTPAATTYDANANWNTISSPSNGVPSSTNLNGVGYTSLTTCSNNTPFSATGSFAAVGVDSGSGNGAIFTSPDGQAWNTPVTLPSGLPALNAVTGYAANQNNLGNPALRWVAVGNGGISVYSTDGLTWNIGRPDLGNPDLRSLTQVAGTFFAVGDAGTILWSTDGISWTSPITSVTSNNLNGVTRGNIYVAVGDSGTIITSADGNTWYVKTPSPSIPAIKLHQITSFGSIYVAVGEGGTIVTSIDAGATWTSQSISATNLVGVTAKFHVEANLVADPVLNYVSTAQFVAVDSSGNTYTSPNGTTWANASSTGISPTNAVVSSGFGNVAAGNSGATAYAF